MTREHLIDELAEIFQNEPDNYKLNYVLECADAYADECLEESKESEENEEQTTASTGKYSKSGLEIMVGDTVHFRADGICGRGIVYLAEKPDVLGEELFRIKDTREGKNFARTYPYYSDASYRIDTRDEKVNSKKSELILKIMNDSKATLHGSANSGNWLIPISRVVEIIQGD